MIPEKALLSAQSYPTFRFEKEAAASGAHRIAGIDEAGRGPLAGPVVAAAVILRISEKIRGVNDSKLLAASIREKLFQQIMNKAVAVGVGIIEPEIIDQINIYQATKLAMTKAIEQISPLPDYLLIDGNMKLDIDLPQRSIIKGDRLCFSVAAAGIVAKVVRDRIMNDLHEKFPEYGFNQHKGYATRIHKEALLRYGPCEAHRLCFRGVQQPDSYPLFHYKVGN